MRGDVVAIARGWVGTPYVHQASAKGAGADCLGLLRGVWRELFGCETESVPAYSPDWSEPQRVEVLWHAAGRHLVEKPPTEWAAGDVVLFRMRSGSVAKHLGIIGRVGDGDGNGNGNGNGNGASFIHSYSAHGVVESPLSAPWRRRIVATFEFPARCI